MSSHDGARVHYALSDPQDGTDGPTLPDSYNGLGYKNLIHGSGITRSPFPMDEY